ncbi:SsrA-binding protein [Candidatus Woesebacteria bacterium RIFCSPLOWO2_01_FULL_39_10]|uniref:SsrA-binding protein n=1 Tax=Candidatus Woesebacteria bacterium RIFCSPLOWO2_01_FULL_39_10 TaxID=1802516 RepID=A0A1F8B595_9BACT|nr:MAG: SsrA-binding protein [Candidatus Woesebacteria bacterium RIFCSPLOWO2_01_FULL_39_10]
MQVINRKAKFNYQLIEKFEAGMVLSGSEVKSIKEGHIDISNAFAKIINGELFLINANMPIANGLNHDPSRMRKLLMHKNEIISIEGKIKQKKLTLVPTKVYTRGPLIKAEVALAKTKRKFEKKELIKKRDIKRDIERELRGKSLD